MSSEPTPTPDSPSPSAHDSARRARDEGAAEFMGPGFFSEIQKISSKRRAFEFWYHPYTELIIFILVVTSVLLLIIEVSMPTGQPVGWMGGIATGTITGWFFWADIIITAILVVEYTSKLWITPSGRKWFFVRNTWIELLSLLPVLRIFRLFRVFRTIRIFRLMRVLRTVRLMRTGNLMGQVLSGYGSDIGENHAGNVIIATYFVSAMLFGTVGILIFEKGAGSDLDTLSDALWWCVVTLSTVGYGDTVPQTAGGRIVAGVVMVLGLGFWSVMIGVFTTSLVRRARQKETMGLDILGIHDHVIVFGWNENGLRLVQDFHSREPLRHLVVVTEKQDLGFTLDTRLHHLRADPTDESTMERAHLDTAQTAVILAESLPDTDDVDVDARTLMTCLSIRNRHPELRVVVELVDEDNAQHAHVTGADDVVVTHNYAGALMSQCVQSPGVHRSYQELFDIGRGARFAELRLPAECEDHPFSEVGLHLFDSRGVTVVGYRRGDDLHIIDGDDPVLRPGDGVIIVESHPSPMADEPLSALHTTDPPSGDIAPSEHVIVCGWSREGHRMVADLYAVAPELSVTIICDAPRSASAPIPRSPHVTHRQADPTSEAVLREAGVDTAHAVVIVADRQHGGSPQTLDARTILTALTVRQISSSVHLIVELRNEHHLDLARQTGADEWLFSDQFSGAMLSQSLQSSGLSRLFTALFETGAGSALAEKPAPSSLVGSTFRDTLVQLLGAESGTPIGLRRHRELHLPPDPDLVIEPGDRLLVVHLIH